MDTLAESNRWLRERRQSARAPLRLLHLVAPLTGILIVAQAWLLARVIDAVVMQGADLAAVQPWLLSLLPVFGLRFVTTWQAERLAFRAANLVKRDVRHELFARLRTLGPLGLGGLRGGAVTTAAVEGVESLEPYFARYLPAMTMVGMVPPIVLLAVFPADWLSGLVLLLTAPLVPLFMILIGKGAEHLNQRQWRSLARMGAHFLNVVQTLATRRMFNASRRELDNIARISDDFRRSTMAVLRVAFLTSAVLEFFAALSIALIAVFVGFRLLDGEMAFLYGLFALLLAPEFYRPLRNFGVQNHARMEAAGAAEQIMEVLGSTPPLGPAGPAEGTPIARTGRPAELVFAGLHFSYPGDRAALAGCDFRIAPGEHVAIVGRSGAGKSTLLNLLLGFAWPQQGGIRVGGRSISPGNIEDWRRQVGWIPQATRLFHGSVIDNIRLGRPEASLNAVINAAERAHALAFIERLPQGLDTLIGEGGRGLSGGQAQRIAIARAVLRDTPYLVLDEPTAHLDHASEEAVNAALQEVGRGRSMLTIAHRLDTVRRAHRVLVMDAGRIVQQGSHAELAAGPGPFRDLLQDGGELAG